MVIIWLLLVYLCRKIIKDRELETLLIAALKEVALQEGYVGIALTCKEVLVGYYEINHFRDFGPSESEFGGTSCV